MRQAETLGASALALKSPERRRTSDLVPTCAAWAVLWSATRCQVPKRHASRCRVELLIAEMLSVIPDFVLSSTRPAFIVVYPHSLWT